MLNKEFRKIIARLCLFTAFSRCGLFAVAPNKPPANVSQEADSKVENLDVSKSEDFGGDKEYREIDYANSSLIDHAKVKSNMMLQDVKESRVANPRVFAAFEAGTVVLTGCGIAWGVLQNIKQKTLFRQIKTKSKQFDAKMFKNPPDCDDPYSKVSREFRERCSVRRTVIYDDKNVQIQALIFEIDDVNNDVTVTFFGGMDGPTSSYPNCVKGEFLNLLFKSGAKRFILPDIPGSGMSIFRKKSELNENMVKNFSEKTLDFIMLNFPNTKHIVISHCWGSFPASHFLAAMKTQNKKPLAIIMTTPFPGAVAAGMSIPKTVADIKIPSSFVNLLITLSRSGNFNIGEILRGIGEDYFRSVQLFVASGDDKDFFGVKRTHMLDLLRELFESDNLKFFEVPTAGHFYIWFHMSIENADTNLKEIAGNKRLEEKIGKKLKNVQTVRTSVGWNLYNEYLSFLQSVVSSVGRGMPNSS
jgi:hypothetical protein